MASRDDCGPVGVIGFCILASGRRFAASGVNYGMVPNGAEALPACPSSAAASSTLPCVQCRQAQAALAANGITHDIKEYPDAGHRFLNEHDSVLFTLTGKLMGGGITRSRPPTRRRIAAFLSVTSERLIP